MDWVVLITRVIVLVGYVAVFAHACFTVHRMRPGGNWTRKATLYIFMAISAFWFVYYAVLLGTRLDNLSSEVTALALFSRIGHYLIIAGLWTVTSFLKMVANRYEVVPTGESVE